MEEETQEEVGGEVAEVEGVAVVAGEEGVVEDTATSMDPSEPATIV